MEVGATLAHQLSMLPTAAAPASLVSKITNHVWNGHFDHEGPRYMDMSLALNTSKRLEPSERLGHAHRVVTEALYGLPWLWLIRSDKLGTHYANIYDGDTVNASYHIDPAFALIMSLCKAVDYERLRQRGALKS